MVWSDLIFVVIQQPYVITNPSPDLVLTSQASIYTSLVAYIAIQIQDGLDPGVFKFVMLSSFNTLLDGLKRKAC
jgi:hypothetical protein